MSTKNENILRAIQELHDNLAATQRALVNLAFHVDPARNAPPPELTKPGAAGQPKGPSAPPAPIMESPASEPKKPGAAGRPKGPSAPPAPIKGGRKPPGR